MSKGRIANSKPWLLFWTAWSSFWTTYSLIHTVRSVAELPHGESILRATLWVGLTMGFAYFAVRNGAMFLARR